MQFYSTKHQAPKVNLKEAVLTSLPSDNGLYMPEQINPLPQEFWDNFEEMPFPEFAFHITHALLQDSVPVQELINIVGEAVNFDAPLVELDKDYSCLELFHGPSLAFKDFGARFMARLMSYLVREEQNQLDILVATSGDTGGAVALGFYKTPNIKVTILYPSGKVSALQEKQLTTLGENITALEIDGTFDDCQALVKKAFLDAELNQKLMLSSANSINIARLIPQIFYYFRAWQQVEDKTRPFAICIPSGNFGNLTAGLIGKRLGLPVTHFVAANNRNNVFTEYLQTGEYKPRPSVPTPSNAMDVGSPSNFQRMMDLYGSDWEKIKTDITAYSFGDEQTIAGVKELHAQYNYIACPHTAVGWLGAKAFRVENPDYHVAFHGTAHASKFLDIVEDTLGQSVPIPEALSVLQNREKHSIKMGIEFSEFKEYLMNKS